LTSPQGLAGKKKIAPEAIDYLSKISGGDLRFAYNQLEAIALSFSSSHLITLEEAKEIASAPNYLSDKDENEHYNTVSAFQKSMRGSDPNAALHYLARLLEAGDLPSATRRLMVCACEDVGLAYPQIIPIVKNACDIALQVGLPEARIPLADAVVLVATSPKSNSGIRGIDAALQDVRSGNYGSIPRQLQNRHFDGEDQAVKGQHYKFPHDYPKHWVSQQYLHLRGQQDRKGRQSLLGCCEGKFLITTGSPV